jgi:hypothetical protein
MVKLPAMDSDSNQLAYDTYFMVGPFGSLQSAQEYIEEMHPEPGTAMTMDLYPPSLSDSVAKELLEDTGLPDDLRLVALGRAIVRRVLDFHNATNRARDEQDTLKALQANEASKKKLAAQETVCAGALKDLDRLHFSASDVYYELQLLNLLPIDFQE